MSAFREAVERHRELLRRRGSAMSAEGVPPTGQAADWYWECVPHVPRSGQRVARQLARLCRDDSQVSIPWRSLADAVFTSDKAGRTRAYTETGADLLVKAGWLDIETVGRGRGATTTFRLMPGDRAGRAHLLDVDLSDAA